MDPAVALVQAYLYANGYFTVAEYPVVEQLGPTEYRSATDVDLLAVRFPGTNRLVPGPSEGGGGTLIPLTDPALDHADDRIEFIIAEVKEGRAELNRGGTEPGVLRAALARFGAFDEQGVDELVDDLIRKGEAFTHDGARIRLMAFGAYYDPKYTGPYTVVTLGQVVDHLEAIAKRYTDLASALQYKDPAIGMLSVLLKARLGRRQRD